jgi:uncharacterized membrane protein
MRTTEALVAPGTSTQIPVRSDSNHPTAPATPLARALGVASVGLAGAQLAAPGAVARAVGVDDGDANRRLLRAVGVRELTSGVGLLTRPRPAGWMWSRVAGDVLDLAMLGGALLKRSNGGRRRIAAALAGIATIGVADVVVTRKLSRAAGLARGSTIDATASITICRPPVEVYEAWRDLSRLPTFMQHLESVEMLGDGRSRWRANGPGGRTIEWEADVTDERPAELIAWRSVEGADVRNEGAVRFRPAPGDRGTEVHVDLRYDLPGGALGVAVATLAGEEPRQQLRDDLRRFKQVMEVGSVVRSEGSPEGMRTSALLRQRPAEPIPGEPVTP